MPEEIRTSTDNSEAPKNKKQQYDDLVKQVADQVWKLWKQELNRERERKGTLRGR